ncbi:hypothetical protein OC835_000372 [Tilletia horrida]|nr:hypothetical protein OC835_000372 [Tilletia horrida]
MFSLARSLQQNDLALPSTPKQQQQQDGSAVSSSSLLRPRPSDPASGRSIDTSVGAGTGTGTGSGSGDSAYTTARTSFGIESELAQHASRDAFLQHHHHHHHQTQLSQRSPLQISTAHMAAPAPSHAPTPSPSSGTSLFNKLPGRRKKQQQQQQQQQQHQARPQHITLPPPGLTSDAPVSPSVGSASRATIVDNSISAFGLPVSPTGATTTHGPAHESAPPRRTSSIFRRPKTADIDRRILASGLRGGSTPAANIHHQTGGAHPGPSNPPNTADMPISDAPAADTIRPLRRLLGPKSASSNALKDLYRRQDANSPTPALPSKQQQQQQHNSGSRFIPSPRSPRTSSSGKRRDFVSNETVGNEETSPLKVALLGSASSAQSTFSRLMGLSGRSSASPVSPGLPSSSRQAPAPSTFGLVPLSPHANASAKSSVSPGATSGDLRFQAGPYRNVTAGSSSADFEIVPASPTPNLRAGLAPLTTSTSASSSASRWGEDGALETLYDAHEDRRSTAAAKHEAQTHPPASSSPLRTRSPGDSHGQFGGAGGYFGSRDVSLSRQASTSSRYRTAESSREGVDVATLALPSGNVPAPAPPGWTVSGMVNSPLPSPSIATVEAHGASYTPALRAAIQSIAPSSSVAASRKRSSTPRLSTTEFPSFARGIHDEHSAQLLDGLPLPLPSPSEQQPPPSSLVPSPLSGNEASGRHHVLAPRDREKRYPPRVSVGEGAFARKRFGSSSSIGVGLGITSPGGTKASVGAPGPGSGPGAGAAPGGSSSSAGTSLAGSPRTSFSHSYAHSQSIHEATARLQGGSGREGGLGRHTSDVGLSSASRQAAAAATAGAAAAAAAASNGQASRKASFGSVAGAIPPPSKLAAAGGAAALFGNGNVGGMSSSVLGNTRQRTSSLFASLTSPFGLGSGGGGGGGGNSSQKDAASAATSPTAWYPPSGRGGVAAPTAATAAGRISVERPLSRNRALSAVELERPGMVGRNERSVPAMPRGAAPAENLGLSIDTAGTVEPGDEEEEEIADQDNAAAATDAVLADSPGDPAEVALAAAAAVDAIKARDNEAQEDIRYYLLGEGKKPAGAGAGAGARPLALHHAKSEERLGSRPRRLRRRSSSSSDSISRARSASQSRSGSHSGPLLASSGRGALGANGYGGSAGIGPSHDPMPGGSGSGSSTSRRDPRVVAALGKSSSSSSFPHAAASAGAEIGDTSEQSDTSLLLPALPTPLPVLTASQSRKGSDAKLGEEEERQLQLQNAEVEAWAEAEAPRLLASLSKTMLRAEIVKFLASTSTLRYPFGARRGSAVAEDAADGAPPAPEPAPLQPELAAAVRRVAMKLYMRRFPFSSDPLDIALRKLLMDIKLPSETQQIDRVMEAFAQRYMECNEGLYISEDQPYILAFSLMMLHTDAFNRNAKHKMTKADYVKNTSTGGVPTEILEYFYDNTTFTQFIHVDEVTDTAVAALPTGGPTASSSATTSQLNSRSASSASLSGLGQSGALTMSVANGSDLLLSAIGTGGNPAMGTFGSFIAGSGSSTQLPLTPTGMGSSSVLMSSGPGGKLKVDPYLLIKQVCCPMLRLLFWSQILIASFGHSQGLLGDLRPNLEHLIPDESPYKYTGTANSFDIGRLRRTFIHAPILEIMQQRRPSVGPAFSPVWNNNDLIGGVPSVIDHLEAWATIKVPKAGVLLRKDDIPLAPPIGPAGGEPAKVSKKAHGRKWKKWGLVLSGSQALFFKDYVWTAALESQMEEQVGEWWADPDLLPRSVSDFDDDGRTSAMSNVTGPSAAILRKRSFTISPRVSYFKPDVTVPLQDAVAVRDESHAAQGEWVFRLWYRGPVNANSPAIALRTEPDGSVCETRHFLLQAASEQEMNEWIGLINYSAAYRSVDDRKVDVQELARILCEDGPSPSLSSESVPEEGGPGGAGLGPAPGQALNGLRRTGSVVRHHASSNSQVHVISSSTSSNVLRAASRKNSTAAGTGAGGDQAGGYLVSPQATMQGFVAHAKAAAEQSAKLLEDELRAARHFGMLTPFQRATRERIETAAIPVAERIRERRLQAAKCASRLEILTLDMEHVEHVAPSAFMFVPTPRANAAPVFEDSGAPRPSLSDGRRTMAYNQAGRTESADEDSMDLKRVDSTPPQLDLDVGASGFDSRFSMFGSDRSGPRSSTSQSSFALPNPRPSEDIPLSVAIGSAFVAMKRKASISRSRPSYD